MAEAPGAFQPGGLVTGTCQVQFFPRATSPANRPAYCKAVRPNVAVVGAQTADPGVTQLQ